MQLVYMAGGIPNRATAMKQGLVDGVTVNPPNEYELEKGRLSRAGKFSRFQDALRRSPAHRHQGLPRPEP